jgi:hypothetical protein
MGVSTVPWSPADDLSLVSLHSQFGPKWSIIAKHLPGRPDNAIKNRWNSSVSKRIVTDPAGKLAIAPETPQRQTIAFRPNFISIPHLAPVAFPRISQGGGAALPDGLASKILE